MTDPANKNRIIIVNDELVGPKARTNNPSGFHPMVRQNWGMIDKLRAVLANYYTVYERPGGEILFNYSSPLFSWHPLSNQVANIVLDLDFDESEPSPILTVTFNEGAWNSYMLRVAASTNFIDDPEIFRAYLSGSYEIPNSQTFQKSSTFPGLLNDISGRTVQDHTSVYYLPLANEGARVQSVYNSYLATVPPYEDVISNPSVKEYVLPNVYIYQAELQNTGSTLLADYHNDALSLGGQMDWFQTVWTRHGPGGNPGLGLRESTESEYYQLYSEKLQQLLAAGTLNNIAGAVMYSSVENNKNLAILHSDMAIADESHLDIAIPFYNKIVIDSDSDSTTGINPEVSILQTLATDDNTKDFIDLLQMKTMQHVLGDDYMLRPYRRELKTPVPAGAPQGTLPQYNVVTVQQHALYNLEAALDDLVGDPDTYDDINSAHTSTNFSLLRDFSRSDFNPDYGSAAEHTEIDLFGDVSAPVPIRAMVPYVTRTFKEVLDGVKCHTETLMYVIEKRRVSDNREPGEIQQRFFISNRFKETNKPIVYYDSQVKYGQRYSYDIKKIALAFGNGYSYGPLGELAVPSDVVAPGGGGPFGRPEDS
jgi:hypothetical protein